MTILIATAVAALACAWVVTARDHKSRTAAALVASARPAKILPCHVARGATGGGTRTCRTRTAVLKKSGGQAPVRLSNIEVSLLGAGARRARAGGVEVDVRVAVRNLLTQPATVSPNGRQLYLSVGERIVWGPPRSGRLALGAGNTSRHRLRFALSPPMARRLWRADGRADLGVRPFRGTRRYGSREIGVLHLRLARPAGAS